MTLLAKLEQFLDNRANAMLVKQMYQAVHSRVLLTLMWLMLGLSLLVYYTANIGSSNETGFTMFTAYFVFLYATCFIITPITTYTSLSNEIKTRTIELINVTPMSPGQQVRGRLQAVLVQVLMFYTLLTPFAVVAYLFKGLDLMFLIFSLAILLLASITNISLSLFLASLSVEKNIKLFTHAASTFCMIGIIFPSFPFIGGFVFNLRGAFWSSTPFATHLILMAYLTLTAVLLSAFFCSAAATMLSFQNSRTWRVPKAILLTINLGASTMLFFLEHQYSVFSRSASDTVGFMAVLTIALICLTQFPFILFLLSQWSYREALHLKYKRTNLARRVFSTLFEDGYAASSLLFVFLLLIPVLASLFSVQFNISDLWDIAPIWIPALFLGVYFPYLAACTHITVSLLRSKINKPFHFRFAILLAQIIFHSIIGVAFFGPRITYTESILSGFKGPFLTLFPSIGIPGFFLELSRHNTSNSTLFLPFLLPALIGWFHVGFHIILRGRKIRQLFNEREKRDSLPSQTDSETAPAAPIETTPPPLSTPESQAEGTNTL